MNQRPTRRRRVALLALASVIAAPVTAQESGDPAAGQRMAVTWCGSCHVVVPSQRQATSNGAPTFAAIAQMTSTTQLGLRAFLQTPHDRMPDLQLSREEIDDVAGYILSLRKK